MCTAMSMQSLHGDTYFGRTMDFSYPLDPELFVIPKDFEWNNLLETHRIRTQYSFMGIGQDISPIIFADGVNEMGFAAAALYFPGYAHYDDIDAINPSKVTMTALELVNFLLSECASVEDAQAMLPTIQIVGVKDAVTNSIAPLHWIIADHSGKCMVVEKTADGLHLLDNPIGVLANSPDFRWQMTNLRNYLGTAVTQQQEAEWNSVKLTPFGQGAGMTGLPGDFAPPARFVRTAFLKSHTPLPTNQEEAIVTCFHIMENVSIPKGTVITSRDAADYTQYTAFIDLSSKEYFFKTYHNSQIVSAKLPEKMESKSEILTFGKLVRPISFDNWNS